MVVGALAVVTFFDHGSSAIGLFRQPYCGSEGLSSRPVLHSSQHLSKPIFCITSDDNSDRWL
jgi:hypothetical protein